MHVLVKASDKDGASLARKISTVLRQLCRQEVTLLPNSGGLTGIGMQVFPSILGAILILQSPLNYELDQQHRYVTKM